ncbi:MAG TPA: GGDEF domain-containing protein [Thermoleophilia bacterium]|jgi:diguanylate cyclase (GGDEF)-like protein|nr:GGDEF domain-containing protein [Thermoleophilia bacterium]
MTATQWGLVCLAAVCIALAVAVARLAARLRDAAARAGAELEALRRELTGLEQGRSSLERLSATDPVTGVWNHRYLQETLAHELERARRVERPLAVLMCDVDRFREVNAAHGHQVGSAVLRELAQRLALEIRSFDTFARYGGEEFVVLLPDTGPEGAAVVADRLCYVARKLVLDAAVLGGGATGGNGNGNGGTDTTVRLTISIGGAVYPESADHAATLIRAADGALAEAKRAGGGARVVLGAPSSVTLHAEATSL